MKSSAYWASALSEEVPERAPFAAFCGDRPVALFRDEGGTVRALEDQCAHRRAPLSLGRVRSDGLIECPYHGWSYDGTSGACKAIPNLNAGESPPARYGVPALRAVEHDGFVYVSDGEAAFAPSLAPPPGARGWRGSGLMAMAHGAFVGLLLDGPGLVLEIGGVAIVDDFPLGDPVLEGEVLTRRFAADRERSARTRKRLAADYPLIAEVRVQLVTGLARAEIRDDADAVLGAALIASTPARPSVTSVRWRGAGEATEIRVRKSVDPAGMMRLMALAGPMWSLASSGEPAPYIVAA